MTGPVRIAMTTTTTLHDMLSNLEPSFNRPDILQIGCDRYIGTEKIVSAPELSTGTRKKDGTEQTNEQSNM